MVSPTVAEYMVKEVVSITPEMTVKEVIDKMIGSNFHGFPIQERGYLLGFVTAKELLKFCDRKDETIRQVMKNGTICCKPNMTIEDATRVLFRYGLRNLPVVDDNRKLVGIISNIDIVRSQIEKARPEKVTNVKSFMEMQNGIRMKVITQDVPTELARPTQKEVYRDELIGRQYELKRGLNEPLIVIKRNYGYLIVDGHHRVMAAKELGMKTFRAVVLVPNDMNVPLGLEKTADRWGLHSLNDVKIIEGSKHPFIETTTMLLPDEELEHIKDRLVNSN